MMIIQATLRQAAGESNVVTQVDFFIHLQGLRSSQSKSIKKRRSVLKKGGGRMLVFAICGFIKNFLTNSYFILYIHHVKRLKMRYFKSLYFNFSIRYSQKCFKKVL